MTSIYKYIGIIAAVLLLLIGVEQYGEHRVQIEWDKDIAIRAALLEAETQQNAKNVATITEQYKKDIEHAKSQAGRAAIADFLRRHGLLPSGAPVQPVSSSQTQGTQGADGAGGQCGPGSGVEEFAINCAKDAVTVGAWQEWAVREGLETQ